MKYDSSTCNELYYSEKKNKQYGRYQKQALMRTMQLDKPDNIYVNINTSPIYSLLDKYWTMITSHPIYLSGSNVYNAQPGSS